eukprot:CAMPEP_0197835640 /NCGR_PEP_ID=MMETSP1437-20131217/26469_1 /TAXON_ID=49252 ORGANISM="Eucampia antarctica, Strain CCMP1452" /NCGR_SAMPLE_ID=MMETSP1437 /ASSEMBLY_ACC=CAM_ASM_001096 /LENGTH=58 /DNA_ID=CAMNT_0043441235 /DNA_START=1 /DNA_END=177 /DNA_ORIENTATION=-
MSIGVHPTPIISVTEAEEMDKNDSEITIFVDEDETMEVHTEKEMDTQEDAFNSVRRYD